MDRRRRNHARRHHRGKLLPKVEVPLIHHELVVIIMNMINMKVMIYDCIKLGEERPVQQPIQFRHLKELYLCECMFLALGSPLSYPVCDLDHVHHATSKG